MMLNAYAFRATKPALMKKAADPNGPLNDETLRQYGNAAAMVIAAWGNHCPHDRQESVIKLIGRDIHCLGINASGTPSIRSTSVATQNRYSSGEPRLMIAHVNAQYRGRYNAASRMQIK